MRDGQDLDARVAHEAAEAVARAGEAGRAYKGPLDGSRLECAKAVVRPLVTRIVELESMIDQREAASKIDAMHMAKLQERVDGLEWSAKTQQEVRGLQGQLATDRLLAQRDLYRQGMRALIALGYGKTNE